MTGEKKEDGRRPDRDHGRGDEGRREDQRRKTYDGDKPEPKEDRRRIWESTDWDKPPPPPRKEKS